MRNSGRALIPKFVFKVECFLQCPTVPDHVGLPQITERVIQEEERPQKDVFLDPWTNQMVH